MLVCYSNAKTLVAGFVVYLFFLFKDFLFFQGESSTKLPAARKKFTSEVPGSDVNTSSRVAASSGSGEMVGREVADNDEFTQIVAGNEEATAGRKEGGCAPGVVVKRCG